jgi:hypothetical protein
MTVIGHLGPAAACNNHDDTTGGTHTNSSCSGTKLAGFGGVALFGVIFYVSNVPRVRSDVLQSIPFFNRFFVKEPIPASDNVSPLDPASQGAALTEPSLSKHIAMAGAWML